MYSLYSPPIYVVFRSVNAYAEAFLVLSDGVGISTSDEMIVSTLGGSLVVMFTCCSQQSFIDSGTGRVQVFLSPL